MRFISKIIKTLVVVVFISTLTSCFLSEGKVDDSVIARVGKYQLKKSEVQKLIKEGMSPVDSAIAVERFITNWAKKKVLLQRAEINLTREEADFERLIEEYREGLISNAYKQKLINEYLDTLVTAAEINEYYELNKHNFLLSNNLLMVKHASFPSNISNKKELVDLINKDDSTSTKKLENLCYQFSYRFGLSDSTWVQIEELKSKLPELAEISDEKLLKKGSFIEKQDSINLYLTRVIDIRKKRDISPLNFVEGRIKNIILNKRKLALLRKMEEQMLTDANAKGEFEVFK